MIRTAEAARRRRGVDSEGMRVMIHALVPAAVPTAALAVAMHCMHTVERVCQSGTPRVSAGAGGGSLPTSRSRADRDHALLLLAEGVAQTVKIGAGVWPGV